MTCKWRNSDSSTLLQCQGLTPLYNDSDIANYATRAGADGPGGPNGYVYWYALSCLRVNRLIRPNIPEGPCGATRITATGTQLLFSNIAKVSTNDPEPISRAIVQGVGEIGAFFSSLFSGAPSAKELQVQCDVANGWNQYADAWEGALRSGQVGLQDALVYLKNVHDQFTAELATVPGGKDAAPYSLQKALDALYLFNKEIYLPQIVPSVVASITGTLDSLLPTSLSSGTPAGASSGTGKLILWGAGIAIFLKILGVI